MTSIGCDCCGASRVQLMHMRPSQDEEHSGILQSQLGSPGCSAVAAVSEASANAPTSAAQPKAPTSSAAMWTPSKLRKSRSYVDQAEGLGIRPARLKNWAAHVPVLRQGVLAAVCAA